VALFTEAGEAAGIAWERFDDPSGYAEGRDRGVLLEAVRGWARETAAQILELEKTGASGFSILMPDGVEHAHGGLVATPLGPRDRAWVERVARDPDVIAEVLPWWDEGRGAGYFRGLALALAWSEVRWRAPIDDAERRLADRVLTAIERAHGLDPAMELPWLEAAELYELVGEDSLRATRAKVLAEAQRKKPGRRAAIGYRRGPVRVTLSGGWSIVIPGELAERWEEEGTWVAWDGTRTLWVSSMTATLPPGAPEPENEVVIADLPEVPGDGELLRMERGPIAGHARFSTTVEEGQTLTVLRAHAVRGPNVALGTVVLTNDGDRQWALETWGTLDHPGTTPTKAP
jgi:hypothetical protein